MASPASLDERDPFIDLLRVACMAIVVLGHWTTTTVVWESDAVRSVNALAVIPATHPATWLLQVMPLVFFAGGFANAVSRRRSSGYLSYLDRRLGRLLIPKPDHFSELERRVHVQQRERDLTGVERLLRQPQHDGLEAAGLLARHDHLLDRERDLHGIALLPFLNAQHLHFQRVAGVKHLSGFVHPGPAHLRDMDQAFDTRKNLYERPVRHDPGRGGRGGHELQQDRLPP